GRERVPRASGASRGSCSPFSEQRRACVRRGPVASRSSRPAGPRALSFPIDFAEPLPAASRDKRKILRRLMGTGRVGSDSSMPRPDVAVGGGGHNGLVCAALLAQAGVEVAVLERRDTLGGAASSCASALHPLL